MARKKFEVVDQEPETEVKEEAVESPVEVPAPAEPEGPALAQPESVPLPDPTICRMTEVQAQIDQAKRYEASQQALLR